MDLSILIVNWNTCQYLRSCLGSIRRSIRGVAFEVIVVDNASHDGSADMVRTEFPEVRLVASRENLGFARGNNLAFSLSAGRTVLVMNPDVELLDGTAEELVRFADRHPEAGALSPKLVNPDGTIQNYYGRIPSLSTIFFVYTIPGSWIDRHLFAGRMRRRDRFEFGDFQDVLWFTDGGAAFSCTLIPRAVIEKIGFMDEKFPVFFNDGDFGVRLFRAGYKACILPNVRAVHHGGGSVRQLDELAYNQEFIYGLRAFYRAHTGWFYRRAIDLALWCNLPARFAMTLVHVLRGRAVPGLLIRLFPDFWKTFAYRPPNVRDHLYTVPRAGGPARTD